MSEELAAVNDTEPAQVPAAPVRIGRFAKTVRFLSLADFAMVALATGMLWMVSEHTWWGTLFTFLPRHALLAAPALLLVCSVCAYRRSIIVNVAAMILAAGPLMGGRIPLAAFGGEGASDDTIRIVSCNVQCFEPDFELVLDEIKDIAPDVVTFQEAVGDSDLLPRAFPGWHILREDQYWIGSRYPLYRVDMFAAAAFPRPTALTVRIDAPQGSFLLHDLHLTTPRYGFQKLNLNSVLDGSGPRCVEGYTERRLAEASQVRAYIDKIDGRKSDGRLLPVVIAGDFNTPSVSNLYRAAWTGFTNAFDHVGLGFGYTAPCTNHRHWFNDVPWVRIDHILADGQWSVSACKIGHSKGSDHRLIWAALSPRR